MILLNLTKQPYNQLTILSVFNGNLDAYNQDVTNSPLKITVHCIYTYTINNIAHS